MGRKMPEVIELVKSSAKGEVVGYETWEIPKIERLYDIEVKGSLKEFLLAMGRCSGGAIRDEYIILYRNYTIRTYLSIQFSLIDDLQRLEHFDLVGLRPFVFAEEGECYPVFLATKEEGEQFVYCFDENEDKVTKTRQTLSDYISYEVKRALEFYGQGIVCHGDLLKI